MDYNLEVPIAFNKVSIDVDVERYTKYGSYRLCVDYRELYYNTVSDRYSLNPLYQTRQPDLGERNILLVQTCQRYYKITMHKDLVKCTAYVTPDGQFEFFVMPFGLKKTPSVFQRTMIHPLGILANTLVVVCMNNVMGADSTKVDVLERYRLLLIVLRKLNLHSM